MKAPSERQSKPSAAGVPQRRAAGQAPAATPTTARARALQRAAGNRAMGRVLARWTRHPDEEQKGVMVPDVSATDYLRFNPPKNE